MKSNYRSVTFDRNLGFELSCTIRCTVDFKDNIRNGKISQSIFILIACRHNIFGYVRLNEMSKLSPVSFWVNVAARQF